MVAGRPKEFDRIQIGKDFIKFASENPSCLTVPAFTSTVGLHSGVLRNWCRESEEFHALFREAKEIIGLNRLRATDPNSPIRLDNGIYRQVAGNYDIDQNEYMREEKVFEASLADKSNKADEEENRKAMKELIDHFKKP